MIRKLVHAISVGTGVALTAAPVGVSAQAAPPLDSLRLLADLAVLAHDSMEGRAVGTLGNLRARHFLERSLEEARVEPAGGRYGHAFTWPGGTGENIVGVVAGRDPNGDVIVITAHYDHLGVRDGAIFNGADDNASGSVALLEIARRLVQTPLEHTVVFALLDAEEVGSWGARAFLERPPVPRDRIALNVNLDMVSRTGGVLWAAGAHHTRSLRPLLEAAAAVAPVELRLGHDRAGAPEGDDWTDASDHSAFHEAGIPFVYFGVEDHVDYHRPTDDAERVNPAEFSAAVRTILIALRELDSAIPFASDALR